ncbi:orange carotenoid protein [Coleofasciculus sp. FACHB-64]|uniref:orange carotenoid protein N-terminal domain-containing protein n=1 Tax=Cyanophyceae TaxID=3028117 RepID=UPI0016866DBD|nr:MULTISPECIES: orange carotenoid protein N-terminal domain-containing protein [unclassified Coleofasciculus]MBD1839305.1 orange carotenoid protein [Coleofasciculus sp. FACHB-501]MBD1880659.1 orange carotenoid protein [Coleofasciculus sp. FACHB-T130]MBD1896454.1 orange carotenoid protein [Coleofasciculus sp. FACHB-129]MBD1901806.1 orange carotenoid protein [Coleofasciculus sp. FACHB-125]MBD1944410.1 orange carotenoid protein [Coleofasciculus sp. FACHB-712]
MTTNQKSQALSSETQKVVEAFEALNTDDKLAWFYYVYEKMGDSITPAAPTATDPELAPKLLGEFFDLDDDRQLAIMREIVNRENTEYSHAYGALKENNQLMVWYAWAQGMGDTVVDVPSDYQANNPVNDLMGQIEGLDFEGQISMFRTIVSNMGYTDVKPIPSQAETGKTASL